MMKYRKKPVMVDATQWFKNGDHPLDHSVTHLGFENGELREFSPAERKSGGLGRRHCQILPSSRRRWANPLQALRHHHAHDHGWIDTLEGGHIVCPGDWIITGVAGELYPCKPAIFETTYDAVEAEGPA